MSNSAPFKAVAWKCDAERTEVTARAATLMQACLAACTMSEQAEYGHEAVVLETRGPRITRRACYSHGGHVANTDNA